jgi:hypothetical protein
MIPGERQCRELLSLLDAVRDGHVSGEQQRRINDLLERYPELQQYYVEFTLLSVELHGHQHLSPKEQSSLVTEQIVGFVTDDAHGHASTNEARIAEIRAIAQRRLESFLAEQEALRREQMAFQRRRDTQVLLERIAQFTERFIRIATWTVKAATRLAVVAAVVLIGLALTQYILNQRVVGTLDEEIHARWDRRPVDANLHPGPMVLQEGFARISLKQGTQIILQAPCAFDLRSKNRVILQEGTVTALVAPQAKGFSIQTPQSTVTDFGTEFGILVKDPQTSEVHVFDGRVQCQVKGRKDKRAATLDITEDKAGVLTASGDLKLKRLGSRPKLFMRTLPDADELFSIPNRRMDLADIVGGGSGFGTGQRYACIDPATGQLRTLYRHEQRRGETGYVTVPARAVIDGVFVPPGKGGSTQVSSAGHHFQFPPAAGGMWFVEIGHGGVANPDDSRPVPLVLGEQTYGQGRNPALLMHANVGITFDLDAIRATLNGTHVSSFTARCGVSYRVRETGDPVSEFYVLVDGRLRFYREIAMRSPEVPRAQVPLTAGDRFLTLVCLAGQENHGDWSFFGDPALELERVVDPLANR